MITIKSEKEISVLREGGKKLAHILEVLSKKVVPGVTTEELNSFAEQLIREAGGEASFLGYQPMGAPRPYPASLCVSVNDAIVHGISNENPVTIAKGDMVKIDLGLTYEGLITDSARTVIAGEGDITAKKMVTATYEGLMAGIEAAKGFKNVGDIGYAIKEAVKPSGFFIFKELGGHGVGYSVHEEPFVANVGQRGRGELLKPGMVLALELMLGETTGEIIQDNDGYTYRTKDGSRSTHIEHTIVITDSDPEILTE
ncbi:MAG: type I methionyl aminopeptidase [Candidatus Paceibacterota bacterium]